MNRFDEKARADRARDVGLFRYGLIRPAADKDLTSRQRGRLIRELAAVEHRGPDGRMLRVSRATLDRWLKDWRTGGFDALVPTPPRVAPRTPARVLDLAVALKKENLNRTAAQVARIIAENGGVTPSERTLQRHFADLGLNRIVAPPVAFGRFEADQASSRWTGDCLHGPIITGSKAILFAWIDDHSRMFVGWRWVRHEDAIRAQQVLRTAIQTYGIPDSCYLDNGAPYVDGQFARSLACLGVKLVHSRPGQPEGRGKIERAFRTVRDGFLVEFANGRQPASIDELNDKFTAWVTQVYHTRTHSETGQAPQQRWDQSWQQRRQAGLPGPRFATPAELHEAFLWSTRRQVTKTATVSFQANTYQVDPALIGCQVELVFDPFDLEHIQVRYRGKPMGQATAFQISCHVHPKARPDPTSPPAGPATGIDFLNLVTARHHSVMSQRIAFSHLITTSNDATSTATGAILTGDDAHPGHPIIDPGVDDVTAVDDHPLDTTTGVTTPDHLFQPVLPMEAL